MLDMSGNFVCIRRPGGAVRQVHRTPWLLCQGREALPNAFDVCRQDVMPKSCSSHSAIGMQNYYVALDSLCTLISIHRYMVANPEFMPTGFLNTKINPDMDLAGEQHSSWLTSAQSI